jgi:hypothetical protein
MTVGHVNVKSTIERIQNEISKDKSISPILISSEDADFRELEDTKAEIKKLRKQAIEDKKVIAILRDATAFFCQDQLK